MMCPMTRAELIMGVELACMDEREVVDTVVHSLDRDEGGWVCPVNLDVLRQCVAEPEIRRLVSRAELAVPDGMPLLWASKLQGTPLPARVSGSSLIWTLSRGARDAGKSVFLLGGNPGVAERAADRLTESMPGLSVVGSLCPPFGFERSEAELDRIETALREARPDIVFVALGFPKQEHLIARLEPALPDTWFVSCGITFSFVAGDVRRAPIWIQRLGLEWLHRLAQEPRRLFRRYVVLGMPFLVRLFGAATSYRVRGGRGPAVEA